MTKLESCWLSEYLVEKCSVGSDSSKWRKSAMSKRILLYNEWCGKSRFQMLSHENATNIDFSIFKIF